MTCGHELTQNGLLLRALQPSDAPDIIRACQDPAIARWTTIPQPYTPADAESFIADGAGEDAVWAICDDGFAGVIGIRNLVQVASPGATASVGYWMAPWARGRGLATRALVAVRDHLAAEHGLVRLDWTAHVGNVASRAVAERAGFTMEGSRRWGAVHRGRLVDVWVGAWTAAPWPEAELVAGRWQVQPAGVGGCPPDLQPLASQARALWAVRHSTSGEVHGHIGVMTVDGVVQVVSCAAPEDAVASVARYVESVLGRAVIIAEPPPEWL